MADGPRPRRLAARHAPQRQGRRLALAAIFEADFGQRTARAALERQLEDAAAVAEASAHARAIVDAVVQHRDDIDTTIEATAPLYPVVGLARMDRALLRSAIGELIHCPATPARVAIAEWVALAREYSGEPQRRLLNGVLGKISADATGTGRGPLPTGSGQDGGA